MNLYDVIMKKFPLIRLTSDREKWRLLEIDEKHHTDKVFFNTHLRSGIYDEYRFRNLIDSGQNGNNFENHINGIISDQELIKIMFSDYGNIGLENNYNIIDLLDRYCFIDFEAESKLSIKNLFLNKKRKKIQYELSFRFFFVYNVELKQFGYYGFSENKGSHISSNDYFLEPAVIKLINSKFINKLKNKFIGDDQNILTIIEEVVKANVKALDKLV